MREHPSILLRGQGALKVTLQICMELSSRLCLLPSSPDFGEWGVDADGEHAQERKGTGVSPSLKETEVPVLADSQGRCQSQTSLTGQAFLSPFPARGPASRQGAARSGAAVAEGKVPSREVAHGLYFTSMTRVN